CLEQREGAGFERRRKYEQRRPPQKVQYLGMGNVPEESNRAFEVEGSDQPSDLCFIGWIPGPAGNEQGRGDAGRSQRVIAAEGRLCMGVPDEVGSRENEPAVQRLGVDAAVGTGCWNVDAVIHDAYLIRRDTETQNVIAHVFGHRNYA